MNSFEAKIFESYSNAEELIKLVRSIDLESIINKTLEQIEEAIKNNDTQKLVSISGVILSGINSKISVIKNPYEKKKMEYLLADIFEDYLHKISQIKNSENILIQIQNNLKSACEIQGYDYSALSSLLNIEKQTILFPKQKSNSIYYNWNGKNEELDELVKDIYDKKWIYSIKEFKHLFKPISGSLIIRCNVKRKNELLLLFQVLKEKGLIIPKGKGNSGHFAPFAHYAVDNEKKFLFQNAPNKAHDLLKRKKSRYSELKREIEHLILQNVKKIN